MKKIFIIFIIVFSLFIVSAEALVILEVESNNTLNTAQNVDNYFSLGFNSDVTDSTLFFWVSVAGTGDGTYDWYSFTANAGSLAYFDIDYGTPTNFYLRLYNSLNQNLLGANDGEPIDLGSISSDDPFLTINNVGNNLFASSGIYYLKVSSFFDNAVPVGSAYQLQISLKNNVVDDSNAIPEPITLGLFSIGLIGLGMIQRKRY